MDKIFYNGLLKTMDNAIPTAQAVAVKNGIIMRVGNDETILKLKTSETELVNLNGKLMLPGFTDSHMHVLSYGLNMDTISLVGTTSISDCIERGKKALATKNMQPDTWLQGRGWNHDYWENKDMPTRYDLDKITTEYPVAYTRVCGHLTVVNSKCLELINVNKNTAQVDGGHFDTDADGEPTGMFRENAMFLIYNKMPRASIEEMKIMILNCANKALSKGITAAHTDDFESLPGNEYKKVLQAYKELVDAGTLPIRIYEQSLLPNKKSLQEFFDMGYTTGVGNDFFRIGPLKLIGDGSLGARTAYLDRPYADDLSTSGIPCFSQQEIDDLVTMAHNNNMTVAIHCIGNGIMNMAMNAFEKVQIQNPKKDIRHSIVHCQITDKKLLAQFRDLNIIAHIQPIFTHYDLHIVEDRVGKDLAKTSYNWKTMLDMGIHIACGSDAPIEEFDILPNIYCAVTRKDLTGYPPEGWYPEQCLSVEDAVYGFTQGPAYASYQENIRGSISIGKMADMVVLDKNIFEIDPIKIKDVQVAMTIIDGQIKYQS